AAATPDPHTRRADAGPRPDVLGPRYAKSVSSSAAARGFDIDEFGIARAELAELPANRSGIAFLVEKLLPLSIGRPPAGNAVVPAGDRRIDSRSKRNAVRGTLVPHNKLTYRKRDIFIANRLANSGILRVAAFPCHRIAHTGSRGSVGDTGRISRGRVRVDTIGIDEIPIAIGRVTPDKKDM